MIWILKISIKPPSVFDIKILLRALFRNSITLFKVIAYNPQNDKVKQLIPFYKLLPNENTCKVVSTDIISA